MQVTWNSKTNKTIMTGRHKGGTPRLWSVSVRVANSEAKETMLFRPKQKMLVSDLEPFIGEHMAEFERSHGEITEASWVANAR
jgi:hypothetical protein